MKKTLLCAVLLILLLQQSFTQNSTTPKNTLQKNSLPAGVTVVPNSIKKDHITVINNSGIQPGKNNIASKQNLAKAYPDWYYIRPDKTGVAGDYHHTVSGDRFGNIWMGGYMVFWEQGSVVRFNGNNTFTDWGSYDGYLPNARVNKIVFDKTDRLWVGTDDGIAMYDNKKWTQFTKYNSALPFAQVIGMAVDNNNRVWVTLSQVGSIESALAYYNGKKWIVYTSKNSPLPPAYVYSIAIDKNNNKWIASNSGLIKFDGTNWTTYNKRNSGMFGQSANDVEIDSLNRVWFTTEGNIDIYDGTKFKHVPRNGWPSGFYATQLFVRGNKVIVNDDARLTLTSNNNGTSWQQHNSSDLVFDNYIDIRGNFWVSGIGYVSNLSSAQRTDYTRYNTQLAEYMNNGLLTDKNNNRWFANGNGGIQVFGCPEWEEYGPLNGGRFPIPQTLSTVGTSVVQDSYGDVWGVYDGTFGYAVQIPNGDYKNHNAFITWDADKTTFPLFQTLQQAEATTNGKVFFRSYQGNVFMYDHATNKFKQFKLGAEINQNPRSMGHDYKGSFYLGGYEQFQTYKNNKWTTTNLSSLHFGNVWDIEFDSSNNMWLGTDSGVWRYDGRNWKNWRQKDGIAADYVRTIKIANGKVYIGAYNVFVWPYYGGISIYDGTKWTSFLQGSSPLPHKQVEGLDVDKYGNLWILAQTEAIAVYRPGGVLGFDCIDTSLQIGNAMQQFATSEQSIKKNTSAVLTISPNPANNFIIINAPSLKNKISMQVFNTSGKMVLNEQQQNSINLKLDIKNLYKGLYILKITDEDGNIQTSKFIKQ